MPIEVHWAGSVEGFTEAELQATVEGAATAWVSNASCTFGIRVVQDPAAAEWFREGGVAVLFGDPDDELADGDLERVVSGSSSGVSFERNGMTFTAAAAAEFVFNDAGVWSTDADIEAGGCSGQLSLQGQLTHELGHVLGLGHSCEQGEACTDADALAATMYGSMEACDTGASTLGADDIEGLAAIYGAAYPFAFTCGAAGEDGLSVQCTVTDPSETALLSPTWDFGDGGVAAGSEAAHTYAAPGSYDVELCVLPPECGEPRCQTRPFVAVSDADTGDGAGGSLDAWGAVPGPGEKGRGGDCGCKTEAGGAASFVSVLTGLTAVIRRRRR